MDIAAFSLHALRTALTRRRVAIATTIAAAVAIVTVGASTSRMPSCPSVLIAVAAAVLAQFGALRFRQADRVLYLGWGEAALIIVAYLTSAGWVPIMMGGGGLVGHFLYRLRTRTPITWRLITNATNLIVAAAVGTAVAYLVGGRVVRYPHPRAVTGLVVGAIAYGLVGVGLVNLIFASSIRDLARLAVRTLRGKLPMTIGNVAVGVIFIVAFESDVTWLFAMPALFGLTYQTYVFRSRASDERRLWREFTEVARSLNHMDERSVGVASVSGVLRLFGAAEVEMRVDRITGPPRLYRAVAESSTVTVADADPAEFEPAPPRPADPNARPRMTRALAIGGVRVGDVRAFMPIGIAPTRRDEMVMSALAETIAAALHDASASRALHSITQRGLHEGRHDPLTRLPNAVALAADGDETLAAVPAGQVVALLVLGLNRFKEVNDSLGHLAGDELLRVAASRLVEFALPTERVARLAGDTFAILLTGQAPQGGVVARAHHLAAHISRPSAVRGVHVAVEVSIGVAFGSAGHVDMAELMRRADIAMSRAKRGPGPVAEDGTDPADFIAGDPERLFVVVDLREALATGDQIVLDVQPVLDLDTGAPQRIEALARWRHPRRGQLIPAEFIDLVDASDLAGPFARYVIDKALGVAETWAAQGVDLAVSVDMSPRTLTDRQLPADVDALLKAHGIPPYRLIVEITESAVPDGQHIVDEVIRTLREIGVQIAVDNFGTGNATLALFTRVQVDEVKIDGGFVARMATSPEAAAIVRIGIDLGRRLGVRVVAQGVQTDEQRLALRDLGCPSGQGRHLMAPADPESALVAVRDLIAAAAPDRAFPIPSQHPPADPSEAAPV